MNLTSKELTKEKDLIIEQVYSLFQYKVQLLDSDLN